MDWISVEESVPEFEKVVLLFGTLKGRSIVSVGWLQSIGKEGHYFRTDKDVIGMDIFLGKTNSMSVTHWCEIELPNIEKDDSK